MIETLIEKFINNPCYLTNGARTLSKRWGCNLEDVYEARREARSRITLKSKQNFKRLFFDIETSYNIVKAWRAGYGLNINPGDIIHERAIICVSYKWQDDDKVYNIEWDKNQNDKELLIKISNLILEADEVVAHNGDRFDIKWLRTRCFMQGLPFPAYVKSLDTLLKSKSMFNFQSNKLDYITKAVNVSNKMESGGLGLWDDIILRKDNEAMKRMVAYCNQDVVALEEFFIKMFPYTKPETHVGVHNGEEKYSCPQCGEANNIAKIKHIITAAGTKQHLFNCGKCNSTYKVSNSIFKHYLNSL